VSSVSTRLFWLALGITIGALIMRKLTAVAQLLTPRGIARSFGAGLADMSESLREFGAEVREAMHEREAEMHEGTTRGGRRGRVSFPS
jgi:hypothetical protein